jgi:hypothetical protein
MGKLIDLERFKNFLGRLFKKVVNKPDEVISDLKDIRDVLYVVLPYVPDNYKADITRVAVKASEIVEVAEQLKAAGELVD